MSKNTILNAIANGLVDGGCQYATNFPGFHSHTIFELMGKQGISLNEKSAYEKAYGGCIAGKRSVVLIKNFGLNAMADAYVNSLITGVHAGLVIVLTEDTEINGSQHLQDSRFYINAYPTLWLEPSDLQQAYDYAYDSFSWSERVDTPIVLRLTSALINGGEQIHNDTSIHYRSPIKKKLETLHSNYNKFIMHPTNWMLHEKMLQNKKNKIEKFVEKLYSSQRKKFTATQGIIHVGKPFSSQEKNCNADVIYLTCYPVCEKLMEAFLKKKKNVKVSEHGYPYISNRLKQYSTTRFEIKSHTNPRTQCINQYHCPGDLAKLFWGLKKAKPSFIVADIHSYTNETSDSTQACLCMGSAVSIAQGLAECGVTYPFSVSGDVSLLHGGTDLLTEAYTKQIPMGVIVINNYGSACTGGQAPASLLKIKSVVSHLIRVDYR